MDCIPRPIEEGEVVFVVDNEKKRQHWQLGLVLQLFEGEDKRSRVALVKIGKKRLLRSIQRLVPLEVRSANEEKARETVSKGCHKSTSSQVKTRTRFIRKPQRYGYE